jgi:hypothetical protein
MKRIAIKAAAFAAVLSGCATTHAQTAPADIPINGTRVFPESITSDAAGNLYNSSVAGTIYRTVPGGKTAEPWIVPSAENGLTSLLGVFADDRHGTLWACNNPAFGAPAPPGAVSSVKAFDLKTGKLKATYNFPAGKPAACNDLAVAADGAVWAAETASGRIVTIAEGANALVVFAEGPELVGVDGIAFAGDGTLYINNVRSHLFQRVNRKADGSYAGITTLTLNDTLNGPDGLRSIGGNRFLQAEGPGGRVALIEVSGDSAIVTPIRTGLDSSPAVTRVGKVGYGTEGKIGYLFDPALRDKDPGPFVIRAFALPD